MFLFSKAERLSVQDLAELEKKLSDSVLGDIDYREDDKSLAQRFCLKIETVSEGELPPDTEAVLEPTKENGFNGVIRIRQSKEENKFACLHEIMHYVFDVGCGNLVTNTYSRKTKGNTPDKHEQKINYLAAAHAMPMGKFSEKIKEYDKSSPKMDEIKFVDDLSKTFQQPHNVVIRRIQEVRSLEDMQLRA